MSFVTANARQMDEILDGTYPVWGEGLSRENYGRWNRAQLETAWGRRNLRRIQLDRGPGPAASAKQYDLSARIGDTSIDVLGIGAVFTPEAARGRGHAKLLIEEMVTAASTRGCAHALLFSEIGAAYYEQLGFRVVPQPPVAAIEVVSRPGAPAVLVRSGEAHDLSHIADISAAASAGAAFALDRSADFIAFGITRKRLLAGLAPAGARAVEFFVTEEGMRAVAYVVITRGPHGWFLEDCGDRDPTGARVGAMLQVLAARVPADQPLRLRAWLPAAFRPPQLHVIDERAPDEIMMLRPLGNHAALTLSQDQIYFPHLDAF